MQRKWQPLAGYMSIVQTDVHAGMRSILVDWLVQVSLVRYTNHLTHPLHMYGQSSLVVTVTP